MLRAVIFDMDGVLIDSEPLWERADRRLIKEYGGSGDVHPLEVDIMGVREREGVAMLKNAFNLTGDVDDLVHARREFLLDIYKRELVARPGVHALLKGLQEAGMKRAVASATAHEIIQFVLRHIGVHTYFDKVISSTEVAYGKPAPDIFFKAAERLNVRPEECVVLEDAPKGIEAANAAGMRSIGVLHSLNSREALKDADMIVESIDQLSVEILSRLMT